MHPANRARLERLLKESNSWHHLLRYAKLIEAQTKKLGASLPPMDPKSGAPENLVEIDGKFRHPDPVGK